MVERLLPRLVLLGALAAASPAQVLCGDCNLDTRVDVLDSLTAAQHDVGILVLAGAAWTSCDSDTSGTVDILDALRVAQVAAGLPVGLQCNIAPVAVLPTPGAPLAGVTPVAYTLVDDNSDPIDIVVEVSLDSGGTWFPGAEGFGPPGEGTTGLSSSPQGESHVWLWNSLANTGASNRSTIRLRITPSDPRGPGTPGETGDFTVANGSSGPIVQVTTPPPGSFDRIPIDYQLVDAESDLCSIQVEFSVDSGNSFAPATEAPGPPGEGTTGLPSAPAPGVPHVYLWDSVADVGLADVLTCRIRITPADLAPGTPGTTADFAVSNLNRPPVATVATPGPGRILVNEVERGLVDRFELTNTAPYAIDVSGWEAYFSYETAAFFLAYAFPPGSVLAPGTALEMREETGTDTPTLRFLGVTISWNPWVTDRGRVWVQDEHAAVIDYVQWNSPAGGLPPGASWSGTFVAAADNLARQNDVDGDDAGDWAAPVPESLQAANPGQTLVDPTLLRGDVWLEYTLEDREADPAAVSVSFSTNGGVTFAPATEQPGGSSDGEAGLATDPSPLGHVWIWNSAADLGGTNQAACQLRLTPSDAVPGLPVLTGIFGVYNGNAPPEAQVTTPLSGAVLVNEVSLGSPDSIEVLNTASVPLDVSGWVFYYTLNNATAVAAYTFPPGRVLSPGVPVELREGNGTSNATLQYIVTALPWSGGASSRGRVWLSSPSGIEDYMDWNSPAGADPAGAQGQWSGTVSLSGSYMQRSSDEDTDSPADWVQTATHSLRSLNAGQTGSAPLLSRDIEVRSLLRDLDSDPLSVLWEFSTSAGATWAPATELPGPPSQGTSGLPSSPTGVAATWVWDSLTDLGLAPYLGVRLRITPSDGAASGPPAVTGPFDVANGNFLPQVGWTYTRPEDVLLTEAVRDVPDAFEITLVGRVPVDLAGWVAHNDTDGVAGPTFTFPGGASLQPGVPVEVNELSGVSTPTLFYVGSNINWAVGLVSTGRLWLRDPYGLMADYVEWNNPPGADPAGAQWSGLFAANLDSLARVTSADTDSPADWTDGAPAGLQALNPGVILRGTPGVVVVYSLQDLDGDACSLQVDYTTDSGGTWSAATEAPGYPSEGTAGLVANDVGVQHAFVWDCPADLGAVSLGAVVGLRLTPSDFGGTGTPVATSLFSLDTMP